MQLYREIAKKYFLLFIFIFIVLPHLSKSGFAFIPCWKLKELYYLKSRKNFALRAAFSSSCRGLQSSAAPVGPFGPNNEALRAQNKILKIHFENFAEICLIFFCKNPFSFFAYVNLNYFEKISLERFWKSI